VTPRTIDPDPGTITALHKNRAVACRLSAKTGSTVMEKIIHDENLKLFRKRLAEATSDEERMVIHKLLAEEEAKNTRRTKDRP
jgi:hypothetical protein